MTQERDDRLLGQLALRNWIALGVLTALSLFWWSAPITQGVLAGGLVAILNYRWLERSLTRVLGQPGPGAARGFQIGYFIRLGSVALVLFALIYWAKVQPVALAVGLSVVVLNILWTTLTRII